jgi:hypothetical protein
MHVLLVYYWGDGGFLLAIFLLVTEQYIGLHLTVMDITNSE